MSVELKVKRSYAIPENEMVIIKDTNTLLHNIVDIEVKEKDKEIERLNNIINELEKYLIERIEYNQGSELQDYLENTYSTIYSVLQELKGSDKE